MSAEHIMPCQNHQSRTCLRLDEVEGMTLYVPFNLDGLEVKRVQTSKFKAEYKEMVDYGVERACQHYLKYAVEYGAADEVMGYLGRVLNINANEANMAKTKAAQKEAVETETKASKKAKAEKPAETTKSGKGKAKPDLKVVSDPDIIPLKKSKAKGDKTKRTVATAFRELIMEGKLTDEKIFAKVQAEFGLDDSRKSYVKWYRNDLKNKGQNPPEPK